MNTPEDAMPPPAGGILAVRIVEGEQLEIDFNLDEVRGVAGACIPQSSDRPEFSICPSCAAQVIKLADGCGVCGWSEEDKLLGGEDKLSIPCTISQPNQPEVKGVIKEDLGDSFIIYIPVKDSHVTVSKLLFYPDFSSPKGYRSAYVGVKLAKLSPGAI